MQSIKYAFRFIKKSLQLAVKHEELQKPWMILSLGNLALMMMGFLPLALTVGLIGLRPIGLIFVGFISTLLVFCLRVWGEITSLSTSQIFDRLILEKPAASESENNHQGFMDHWDDIFMSVLTLPVVRFFHGIRNLINQKSAEEPTWLKASGLRLPVIAQEDLDLESATLRVGEMVELNLLRIRPEFIGVNLVSRVIEWLLLVIGIVLGFVVSFKLANPLTAGPWRLILGAGIGLLLGGVFTTLGVAFSTFARASYHTALYRWGQNSAMAQRSGDAEQAVPPMILGQVLGRYSTGKKEG